MTQLGQSFRDYVNTLLKGYSEEAHEGWRKRKHELAQQVAAKESDPRVVEALKERYSFEEWYK